MTPLGWLGRKTSTQTNRLISKICWSNLILCRLVTDILNIMEEKVWCWKNYFHQNDSFFSHSQFLLILDYWILYALRQCIWYSACMVKSTWLEEFVDKFWHYADSLKLISNTEHVHEEVFYWKNLFWQNDWHFNFAICVYPYVCLSVCLYWFSQSHSWCKYAF